MTDRVEFERRRGTRFSAEMDVEWESPTVRGEGTLSDISEGGCLVLCGESVVEGEPVRILFPLGDGMKAEVAGKVVNVSEDVGFAVKFGELSPAQRDLISKIIRDSAE